MRPAQVSAMACASVLLATAGLAAPPGPHASAAPVSAAVTPCSSGLVALTFDDGPETTFTPGFLTLLQRRQVPATFFVLGEQVQAHPRVLRQASALGFTIGNHSFGHENLVRLSDQEIRATLRRTRRAIGDAGVRPSRLMRPPYGSIDARVRRVVAELGLVPVLWTADPRDWDNRSASAIAASTLAQLRPHEPNIVLLHDGVRNSGKTLRALPRIIRVARARGYCFAGLGGLGRPAPPVPIVRVSNASVQERPGGSVMTATVTLDRPTSRATSVRVRTVAGSASAGPDYVAVDERLGFAVGARTATVRVRVRDDLRDEATERLTLRLSAPRGLRIKDAAGVGEIRDDDPPPRLSVRDAQVAEPAAGKVDVPVELRLSRASGKRIQVSVSTQPGTADANDFVPKTQSITFAPGQVTARFIVTVLADAVAEGPETFTVRATGGSNVELSDVVGVVTILRPPA